jgi:hypothetical protein
LSSERFQFCAWALDADRTTIATSKEFRIFVPNIVHLFID